MISRTTWCGHLATDSYLASMQVVILISPKMLQKCLSCDFKGLNNNRKGDSEMGERDFYN